jgi:lipopolysaccharide transport system ATP-binding protein
MSTQNSIEVSALSKRYILGEQAESGQLREHLSKLMHLGRKRKEPNILWALQDLSFSVPEGQVVGIIGRNGAGKSTLLKILSKITHPTMGNVRVRGRVASLLEVGTGFHEELTGRENVYLNGSILGMKRREIDRHFDAIVEFSGLAQFIDTPIKRFSSGMRLRLGFAVAAHLDPDVLIVDEVLAVGDAGFQKKCIAAMADLRTGGRTVLFVSHNMAAVENLCSRGIWIDQGRMRLDGAAKDVIKAYLGSYVGEESSNAQLEISGRIGTGAARFTKLEFMAPDGLPAAVVQSGDSIVIRIHYHAASKIFHPKFYMQLYTNMGTLVTETTTALHGYSIQFLEVGDGYIDLELLDVNLLPSRYMLVLTVKGGGDEAVLDGDVRARLDVEPSAAYGTVRALDSRLGIVYFKQKWRLNEAVGLRVGAES